MSSCTQNSGEGIHPGLQQKARDVQSSGFIEIWKWRQGMNFIFLLLKMGGREKEERKEALPCYLRKSQEIHRRKSNYVFREMKAS